MVTSTRSQSGEEHRYILRPNCSLSWSSAKLCFAAIAGVTLTVAAAFAFLGLWPVLPFAGLELAVLGYCFYRCAANAQHREVITVGPRLVKVEKGKYWPDNRWDLPRAWAVVAMERHAIRGYPSRPFLRSHGRRVEFGSFLSEEERRELAVDLSRSLGRALA